MYTSLSSKVMIVRESDCQESSKASVEHAENCPDGSCLCVGATAQLLLRALHKPHSTMGMSMPGLYRCNIPSTERGPQPHASGAYQPWALVGCDTRSSLLGLQLPLQPQALHPTVLGIAGNIGSTASCTVMRSSCSAAAARGAATA